MKKFIGLLLVVCFILSLLGSSEALAQTKKGVYDPIAKSIRVIPNVGISKKMSIKPATTTPTAILKDGFELSSNWVNHGCWEIGTPSYGPAASHGGFYVAGTSLSTGYYPNSANDTLFYGSTINLPTLSTAASKLELRYWEWTSIEPCCDRGMVLISSDDGTSWTQIVQMNSSFYAWQEKVIDISSYAGKPIKLAFQFYSDQSVTNPGWYLDDVQIVENSPPPPKPVTALMTSINAQNFPTIYMNVAVNINGLPSQGLAQSNFQIFENGIPQSGCFDVTPPSTGGGVRRADIVFLVDNSGSMQPYQDSIRSNVFKFVDSLAQRGVDFALGLCRYGQGASDGLPFIEDNGILTSDQNYFKNTVWTRNVVDGGTEPGYNAMTASASGFSFRSGAQKIFIILTDETPNQTSYYGTTVTLTDAQNTCVNSSITLFALTDTNYLSTDFSPITTNTNGAIYNLFSSFSPILNAISAQISNSYIVRYCSGNTARDGVQRDVNVVVTYYADQDTASGFYIPGQAPEIHRTNTTVSLHNQSWPEATAFTIEVNITDNVAPFTRSAILHYKNTADSVYTSLAMDSSTSRAYWHAQIPSGAVLRPGVDYYITATDGQSSASDPTIEPNRNPYQIAILPNVAPVITHTPPTTLSPGSPLTINANIVDNTNYLALVKLFYRKTGQLVYTELNMVNASGSVYQGIIDAMDITMDGIDYYIEATDNFGVSAFNGTPDKPNTVSAGGGTIGGLDLIFDQVDATRFPTINAYVSVNDQNGDPISGLDNTNFSVYEDNYFEQPITVLSLASTSIPLSVALVIDRSGSMGGTPLADAQNAAKEFVDNMNSSDRVALVSYDDVVRLNHSFTYNKAAVKLSIDSLVAGNLTATYKALLLALNTTATELQRKAIILLTDGDDNSSAPVTADTVITFANRLSIPIHCIGLNTSTNTDAVLLHIATSTGGRYFRAPSSNDLAQLYQRLSQQMANQYQITYTTHNQAFDGRVRRVRVDASFNASGIVLSDTASRTYIAPAVVGPKILRIVDVPNDNGRHVYVKWMPSPSDMNRLMPVSKYVLWRLDRIIGWVYAGEVPTGTPSPDSSYTAIAPTIYDSTKTTGMFRTTFVVTAWTSPLAFATSKPDSGYSLDNLAPGMPSSLIATRGTGNTVELRWNRVEDIDLFGYVVYRALTQTFVPGPSNKIGITSAELFMDNSASAGTRYYYKITSVDHSGNESVPAPAVTPTSVEADVLMPTQYALNQNYPNPFNPSTTIRYSVPMRSAVRLVVFNTLGEQVATLENKMREPGYYTVSWQPSVASGMYYYRIDATAVDGSDNKFTETKKMILLK
jgi:VWFA-related protein